MNTPIIITIDGPAGVGKSTIAKQLGTILHIPYLDTGAMYRKLALYFENTLDSLSQKSLEQYNHLVFQLKGIGQHSILLFNGIPIGNEIRTEMAGTLASKISSFPLVRTYMKNVQQELGKHTSLIAEGRDMGTEVFPNAQFKFFLDANLFIRAERRFNQLEKKGDSPNFNEILRSINYRDECDRAREIAPLTPANDAIVIDTSSLDIENVLKIMLDYIVYKNNKELLLPMVVASHIQ